ncbi:MAG: BRCT domain-containing protein [Polyangiaceae bacterium]
MAEPKTAGDHLKGIKLVLTGDLKSHERDAAGRLLKALGADVTTSVSGKTTAVIAGEAPGEKKLSEARKRGLPILNEEQFLALLAGQTLDQVVSSTGAAAGQAATQPQASAATPAAPLAPKFPFPESTPRPRDGVYTEHFPGSDKPRIQGAYAAGLKQGSWKKWHENGQLAEDYSYDKGMPHGPELDFHPNGKPMCVGENRHGKRVGVWTWYYESGAFNESTEYDERGLRHGELIWDLPDGRSAREGSS